MTDGVKMSTPNMMYLRLQAKRVVLRGIDERAINGGT